MADVADKHRIILECHHRLKQRLRALPDDHLFLLQRKPSEGEVWAFTCFSSTTSDPMKYHFNTVKLLKVDYLRHRVRGFEYRIVSIGRSLPSGFLEPLVRECRSYFPAISTP